MDIECTPFIIWEMVELALGLTLKFISSSCSPSASSNSCRPSACRSQQDRSRPHGDRVHSVQHPGDGRDGAWTFWRQGPPEEPRACRYCPGRGAGNAGWRLCPRPTDSDQPCQQCAQSRCLLLLTDTAQRRNSAPSLTRNAVCAKATDQLSNLPHGLLDSDLKVLIRIYCTRTTLQHRSDAICNNRLKSYVTEVPKMDELLESV